MPLSLDTRTPMKLTLAGPDGASASSVARYIFPETPANGALSCVPDSTGTVGQLTWIAANVVIYNPPSSGLYLTTQNNSTSTAWAARTQVLPNFFTIPFKTTLSSSSLILTNNSSNPANGAQGVWFRATPATNNIITVRVTGTVTAFTDASALGQTGVFTATFGLIENAAGANSRSFPSRWTVTNPIVESTTSLLNASGPITTSLLPAGPGKLDCNLVIKLNATNQNAQAAGIIEVTSGSTMPDLSPTISEAAT